MTAKNGHNGKLNLSWLTSFDALDLDVLDIRPEGQEMAKLTESIVHAIGRPVDPFAVTATLESMGWRDMDARELFNKKDLFELGREIYYRCQLYPQKNGRHNSNGQMHRSESEIKSFLRYYGRGSLFMLPIVAQILVLFFLRFSLWASLDLSQAQATVVAIGTILSFIVTGGFVQSIGRDTIYYLSMKQYLLVKKSFYKQLTLGVGVICLFAFSLFVFNLIFPFYGLRMSIVMLTYFVLLALLWLLLSILYVIKHYVAILAVTLLGVVPVYLIMHYADWGIYRAHFTGLVVANILAFGYGYLWLRLKSQGGDEEARLPRVSTMTYLLSPYFIAGLVYFVFLFADRLVGWSAANGEALPFIIWFRTPYELGMDWALVSLLLTVAMLEYSIERFSRLLVPKQQSCSIRAVRRFSTFFRRFYKRQFILLIVIGTISIFVTYFAILLLRRWDSVREIHDFFSHRITFFTFYFAAPGYFFLSVGLLNTLLFFTLSRPGFTLKSILPALATDVAIGFAASRWFGYEYAVLGLLAGGLVYALVSTGYIRKYLKDLDYYYYSAF